MSISDSEYQYTIEKKATISGVGIHTGNTANVVFRPAPENHGIVFKRVDLDGNPEVPASIDYVSGVERGTTVQNGAAKVQTIEHLLATVYGLGIDNMLVEIDTDEMPVGDGSAGIYTDALLQAGIKKQSERRKYYKPSRIMNYRKGKTELIIIPSDSFTVSSTIHYGDDVLGSQFMKIAVTPENYVSEISSARTYCFESEIEHIKIELGLGKGGNFENTVVVGASGIKNTTLRFRDEFVRHKILDLLGDLFLLGIRLKADVISIRGGHASNIELAKKVRDDYLEISGESSKNEVVMDITTLMDILPHRYPFLLVDRIVMDRERNIAKGYKNVTVNEPFFKGHFPDNPVFPSVLVMEFMAQSSAVLLLSKPEMKNKLAYFIIIENAEFFNDVKPMDLLESKVELVRARAKGGKVKGVSYVGDRKIAEVEFMFSVVDR